MQHRSLPVKLTEKQLNKKPKKFKKFLKRYFGLPSPKELGRSDINALPMDFFSDNKEEYTWEDYDKEMKNKYPIRYFLNKTAPHLYAVHIAMPISDFIYKIKSCYIRKDHLLDLRQPKSNTLDDYDWGYRDQDSKLVFACFNLLLDYYHEAERVSISYSVLEFIDLYKKEIEAVEKQISETTDKDKLKELNNTLEHWKTELHLYSEIQHLYVYWTGIRKTHLRRIDELQSVWHEKRKRKYKDAKRAWEILRQAEKDFDEAETDALIRLIEIRHCLWV